MTRRFQIALVVAALMIAAPAALASGEDAQADAQKKQATGEAAPAAPATDDAKKTADDGAADKDEAKKQLEEGKFNTLEDLFALLAAPTLTVADTSIEPGNAAVDAPTASGVQWTRVEPTERSD